MELKRLSERAMKIRNSWEKLEKKRYGKSWTVAQVMEGFVVDVGELMELVMAKEGIRNVDNVDEKLSHELSDCLWSVLVLAEKFGIDIEKEFLDTMDNLEKRIEKGL